MNYKNLSLYKLTLGKILKDKCNLNSFVFYISQPLPDVIYVPLPIKINDDEEKKSTCKIINNSIRFGMYCLIYNFCPNDSIYIKIENKYYYYYILNLITIQYFNNNFKIYLVLLN